MSPRNQGSPPKRGAPTETKPAATAKPRQNEVDLLHLTLCTCLLCTCLLCTLHHLHLALFVPFAPICTFCVVHLDMLEHLWQPGARNMAAHSHIRDRGMLHPRFRSFYQLLKHKMLPSRFGLHLSNAVPSMAFKTAPNVKVLRPTTPFLPT